MGAILDAAQQLEPILGKKPVLFVSGYSGNELLRHGIVADDVHLLPKPFTPAALLKSVRTALVDTRVS